MTSDRLFVYGTLMRGFDHPMAQLLSRSADFIGEARCRGRLYLVKHYPGLVLSDDPADVVFGELYRLRQPDELLREFDMYEACGEGFAEPTEYIRQMLPVTLGRWRGERGLDLHLQLAGRAPAADRLGAVSGNSGGVSPRAASARPGTGAWRPDQPRKHRPPGPPALRAAAGMTVVTSIRGTSTVRPAFSAWPSAAYRNAAPR